MKYSTDN